MIKKILKETDDYIVIAKYYVDGGLKIEERWKNPNLKNRGLYLMVDEVNSLKELIN